ncbi:MAG: hypothetical protein NTX09_19665 [Verrucomicrobia bacterium]|jgi:MFS family permease|nr:hypothetical protein [Verrucomicrobiota bacterium]
MTLMTSVTVDLPFLLVAVALLWFPRHWLRLGSVFKRRRSANAVRAAKEPWNNREQGDPRVSLGAEFSKFRNYVDLLRAGAGSLALFGGLGITSCLGVAEGAPRNIGYAVIGLRALILLIGLLVQTVRFENNHLTFYPPIFYLAGLTVGLSGYRDAGFAFVLIWALSPVFGGALGLLTIYAALVVGFGYVFNGGVSLSSALAGFLCFLPALLSMLANRPLVVLSRKGSKSGP